MPDTLSREFDRLSQFLGDVRPHKEVPLSIGDDGAHLLLGQQNGIIAVSDMMMENIHFRRSYTPPKAIGHKILAVNLSDIAAMGAVPKFALLNIAAPKSLRDPQLKGIFDGVLALGERHGVTLVGGDLTAAPEGALCVSLTCLGTPGPQGPLTRRNASPGDLIAIIGTLGGAALDLEVLESSPPPIPGEMHPDFTSPLLFPTPWVQAGIFLGQTSGISSLIDLSDGLFEDLKHILEGGILGAPSKIGAHLNLNLLPLHPSLLKLPKSKALALALYGGEDYALLLTAPATIIDAIQAHTPLTIIGEIRQALGVTTSGYPLPKGRPWHHFETEPIHG